MTALAPLLQGFFTQRLAQRRASPATVAAYRDSFRLLLRFASERAGKAPSALEVSDMDAETVSAFLDHLETARDNGVRSRNLRLTAVHALFKYAALACPQDAETIRRVLAIPAKRGARFPHRHAVAQREGAGRRRREQWRQCAGQCGIV